MAENQLLIDINIEALYLDKPKVVSTPLGEYSGLPWLLEGHGRRPMDINFDNAYLGEEVLFPAFQNESMLLEKGVHLHFINPSFLGREVNNQILAAPNRWMVSRQRGGRSWFIASDYVHYPEMVDGELFVDDSNSIFPIPPNARLPVGKPPYCYLGKKFGKTEIPNDYTLNKNSLLKTFGKRLTVLGFGNIQFSASYPNCKTVFGLHDSEGRLGDIYNVVGWHSNPADDLLPYSIYSHFGKVPIPQIDLKEFLAENFDLDFEISGSESIDRPTKTLYQGRVKMDKNPAHQQLDQKGGVQVSIGNNSIEAISALIGAKMDPNRADLKVKDEDDLEFIMLNDKLDGNPIDQIHKFVEARHQNGFTMNKGGSLYSFKDHKIGKTKEYKGYSLPESLYNNLNKLNEKQHLLNERYNELKDEKSQLYTDWYKYMRAAYPPTGSKDDYPERDDLEMLIHHSSLIAVEKKEEEIEILKKEVGDQLNALKVLYLNFINDCIDKHPNPNGGIINKQRNKVNKLFGNLNNSNSTEKRIVASQDLKKARKELEQMEIDFEVQINLKQSKKKVEEANNPYPFKELPEKPFWEPNEPVIAIDGFNFNGRQNNRKCTIKSQNLVNNYPVYSNFQPEQKLSEKEWCPFFMEWDVGLFDAPINISKLPKKELPNAFFDNYYLDNDTPGIFKKSSDGLAAAENDSFIRGGTVLSPYLQNVIEERLIKYLEICDKYPGEPKWKDNKTFASRAKEALKNSDVLCQRLSGFNAACLMFRQVPQLEMKEPLGFESSLGFTKLIKEKCKGGNKLSPTVVYDFLPIRNGALKIRRLRFIDNFGISEDLRSFPRQKPANTMISKDIWKDNSFEQSILQNDLNKHFFEVFLPPRIIQPCRLNFHFLEGEYERMTENPHTSPIVGWFMPNLLDERLLVYDKDGVALGLLGKHAEWLKLPWETSVEPIETKVKDPYFRSLLKMLLENETKEPGFMDSFLTSIEGALENIAPAFNYFQNAKALLFGRAVAVVRVEIGLQIKGYQTLDQSWQATLRDIRMADALEAGDYLSRDKRYSSSWNDVEFPLRLGEYRQLNDGLVGYWKEDNDGFATGKFYAPQTEFDASKDFIYSRGDPEGSSIENLKEEFTQKIKADGESFSFTVLMDPKGILHATTGILPTASIRIPDEFYEPALEKMHLWFETGPILQYREKIKEENEQKEPIEMVQLNLPDVPEFDWKWVDSDEVGTSAAETKKKKVQKPVQSKLYEQLPEIKSGYLVLLPKEEE